MSAPIPTEKREIALRAYLDGSNFLEAAQQAGVTWRSVSRWVKAAERQESDRLIAALQEIETALQDAEKAAAIAESAVKTLRSIRWQLIVESEVAE